MDSLGRPLVDEHGDKALAFEDEEKMAELRAAFRTVLGALPDIDVERLQSDVFRMVSAVLRIGNIGFRDGPDGAWACCERPEEAKVAA